MTAALTAVGVQEVTITIANGATTGTASVSTLGTGAFIVQNGQTTTDSTTGASALARVEITNTGTITATRNTSSTDTITVKATIQDGDPTNFIKTVQNITTTILSAATSGTTTISAVTNANTFIFQLGTSTAAIQSLTRDLADIALSGTTLTATRGVSNGALTVGTCVVEAQSSALNSSTQNVTVASAIGTSWQTVISSITTNNTFLANGGAIFTISATAGRTQYGRLSLADATHVQIDANTSPGGAGSTYACVVVELVVGMLAQNIQRGTIALTAAVSNTGSITASALAQTMLNWLNNSTNLNGNTYNVINYNVVQTNTTTITEAANSSATGIGSFEAMQLNPASAGIAFDAVSNSGYQAASSSYTWNHTCTGSNGYLSIEIAMLSLAQTVTALTYNGAPLEFMGAQNSITGAARIELWGIPAPATGTNTISVTMSGAIASAGVASSYTGVNQASPVESFNSAQATNVGAADATVTITTVSDNCWVIAAVATDDASITSNNTSRNNVTGAGGSGANSDNNAAKTPAGAVVMSWTNVGALATWAIVGIALRPIADAALDISWFPVFSDQSRPNRKVQRDFFFAGIQPLNFQLPWLPTYPDQSRPNLKIQRDFFFMAPQPLNLPLPWQAKYPNQMPFFNRQLPSGLVDVPIFPLNFQLPWLPVYADLARKPAPVKGPSFFAPNPTINLPMPWLPLYPDAVRLRLNVQNTNQLFNIRTILSSTILSQWFSFDGL